MTKCKNKWNLKWINLKKIIQVSDNMEVDKINSWMKMNPGTKMNAGMKINTGMKMNTGMKWKQ